jgi:ABC-type uncharacterized transport system ATPase subunit
LSPSGKQKLEILKLLWRNSKIMILDEPTAMLSPADGDALFNSLELLVAEGATVLLVTHRVREVIQRCSQVTVVRAGRVVADMAVHDTNDAELSNLIVGKNAPPKNVASPPTRRPNSKPILKLANLSVRGERGNEALKSVSLEVFPGEIVGIAGVDGNGQHEMVTAIAGLVSPASGSILIGDNLDAACGTRERLKAGLRIVPEDRNSEGAIEQWSLEENCALGLHRLSPLARGNWIDLKERLRLAQSIVARFSARHGGLGKPMASLSGGNQQRIVVARALELDPRILIAFQPARGLDLGATSSVYQAISEACGQGMAAIVVSFDLDELLAHCSRVLVLNHGVLREPPPEKRFDRSAIGALMVGAA